MHRVVNDKIRADDVFSDAVLAAYRSLHKFKEGTDFRAWVYRILLNKSYVENRKSAREVPGLSQLDEIQDREQLPEFHADGGFEEHCDDALVRGINRLNPSHHTCLLLRAMEGCSYQEISDRLKMLVGTVMTNLSRARAKLRSKLGTYALAQGWLKEPAVGTA